MFKNYLVVALRNLTRNRLYSLINIAGFAIGLAVCLLIFLYIQDDLSFDRFNPDADRIYRVYTIDSARGVSSSYVGITMPAMAEALKNNVPEVENSVKLSNFGEVLVGENLHQVRTESMFGVQQSFLEIFGFKLLRGDEKTVLDSPGNVLLTPELANRIFGDEDPIGQALAVEGSPYESKVTGIIEAPPSTSHLQFDALFAMVRNEQNEQYWDSWGSLSMVSYIKLAEGANTDTVQAKAIRLARDNGVPEYFTPQIQPILDLHLHASHMLYDLNSSKSDASQVRALGIIAIFVLIIASVNFMNLSTARASRRAKEVGLRKVVGAGRHQMTWQFLSESVLLTFIATVFAVVLVEAMLPYVNNLTDKSMVLNLAGSPQMILGLLATVLVVGTLSGLYPALVLSGFNPAVVLKGEFKGSKQGILTRRILVIGQFAISIALIVGTLVVSNQLRYITTMDPGYDRDQVLLLSLFFPGVEEPFSILRDKLREMPEVAGIGNSSNVPGRLHGRNGVRPEGLDEDRPWIVSVNTIDEHFLPNLGIEIVEGRNFSPEFGTDDSLAVIINQAMARSLGWEEPLGKRVNVGGPDTENFLNVVGVVEDYHFATVRHQIEPLMFYYDPTPGGLMSVRIQAGSLQPTMRKIEQAWNEVFPSRPFEFSFMDDEFNEQYRSDKTFAQVVSTFSILAVLIACLGLFGLASYTTEQRRKEIAVRKVLGSGEGQIVMMLASDFLKWVLLANVIAWPIAWFAMREWLNDFIYRVDLNVVPFLGATLAALLIALLTVSAQSMRAARTNPAEALRQEL
ncbi:ABC transporter permease [bacterium]|nr:ABC transporter permease [bacterium]